MPNNALTATILTAMREHWELGGISDHTLEPHARRLIDEVRSGLSEDALVADLTNTFCVELKRPVGGRYMIERLAKQILSLAK